MIQIFGHPASTCTRKVLTVLAETNTPYELNVVDLSKGEHKQPPHVARQPFGQIPVLDDDGFRMFESRAIARYLDEKSGSPLTPKTIRERALMNQWQSVEQSNFSPAAMKFVYHYVFQRPQDQAVLDGANRMVETTLGAISKSLAEAPYLTGNQFTLADIGYMPYIEYTMGSPLRATFEKFPHVMSWWNRVS
ncbi:MAG TPA: glutathione S-transferase N-terminal domain-containing protein, partial [Polyangiaceae bacterium]|nr:glutathione S-transferase N-terminal domain-containing protein [Polyangiaceae bacterium]